MDYLLEELGGLPFRYEQIARLIRRSASLVDELSSGSEFSPKEVVRMVDMLQAILNLTFCECGLAKFVPELIPENPQTAWDVTVPPDFEKALSALPLNLLELKELLFERLGLSKTCRPHPEGASICHHCNFALERVAEKAHSLMQRDIVDGRNPNYLLGFDRWPDFPTLARRAKNGCKFCEFVRGTLQSLRIDPQEFGGLPVLISLRFLWGRDNLVGIAVMLHRGIDPTGASVGHRKEFYIESMDDTIVAALRLNRARRKNPLDPANIVMVQENLKSSTTLNKPSESPRFVPRRLIDLGPSRNSAPILVTLDNRTWVEYATLSYCWGPPDDVAKQSKTTRDTIEAHRNGIPRDAMSAVIRDAIVVCKTFNIRYLWVDALCILQGDLEDWQEQSSHMSDIFGNSYLAICPVASSSCVEGFLDDRPGSVIKLGYKSHNGSGVNGWFSLWPGPFDQRKPLDYSIDSLGPLIHDIALSPWSQRGWVYQEKCLSPRKLYFGRNQVHYQIGDKVLSENGHVEILSKQDNRMHREWPKDVTMEYLASHKHPKDYWYELAEQVALLKWTVRSDFFPSISGLAIRFQKVIGSHYLAGIWANDLHCGLLWIIKSIRVNSMSRRPESVQVLLDELKSERSQVGPSWSWAGDRSGRLEFLMSTRTNFRCRIRSHLRPEFTVLESNSQVNGANPFGKLQTASLRLSGRVVVPKIEKVGRRYLISRKEDGLLAVLQLDWGYQHEPPEIDLDSPARLLMLLVSSCCSDSPVSDPTMRRASPEPYTRDPLEIKINLVYKARYERSYFEDSSREGCSACTDPDAQRDVWGLLLHTAEHSGAFYRVGAFVSRAEQGGMKLFNDAEERTIELL